MKVVAQVEMPKGTRLKYENKNGQLVVDRILPISVPYNYGFIPNSEIQEDGDLIDIFIVSDEPILPGTTVTVEVVATLVCMDNGIRDDKLISVFPNQKISYAQLAEITDYLNNYKTGFQILEQKIETGLFM